MTSSKSARKGGNSTAGHRTSSGSTTAAGNPVESKASKATAGPSKSAGGTHGSKSGGRTKVRKEAPGAPKRPLSAYMLFVKAKRGDVVAKNPELKSNVRDVARILGEMWREATPASKEEYTTLADQERARYGTEVAAYKQQKTT